MLFSADKIALLRGISLFAELPDGLLAELAGLLQPVRYVKGQVVFGRGEQGDCMYIIASGQVMVHDGELVLSWLGAAEVFGEMAILDAEPRMASVTAQTEVLLYRLDQQPFYQLMAGRSEVLRAILRILLHRLRLQAHSHSQDFHFMQQMQRVTTAAAALESGTYHPAILEEVCLRNDELGQLGRVFRQMAGEVEARQQIQIARRIQASFLPVELPSMPGWDVAVRFQPARQVAGDFYDIFPLKDDGGDGQGVGSNGMFGIVVADVCDKGVGAALYMAMVRTLIRAFSQQHFAASSLTNVVSHTGRDIPVISADAVDAAAILHRSKTAATGALRTAVEFTNNYIARTHQHVSSLFASVFFAILDVNRGTLWYVNAGHEPPVIAGARGPAVSQSAGERIIKKELRPTGPVVGIIENARYGVAEVQLEKGDVFFAFTDALNEAINDQDELYGYAPMHELIVQPHASMKALLDQIEVDVLAYCVGAELSDDLTMLAISYQGADGAAHIHSEG